MNTHLVTPVLTDGPHPPETAAPHALACRDLTYRYGRRRAVDGLTFAVRPGEAYGLLGPNGAGKTTTIRLVCGISAPQSGTVAVAGRRLRPGAAGRAARAGLGYVPQDVALYPTLSVAENLHFWATVLGVPRRRRPERAREVLELVGLADRAGDRVDRCSGGMQRRVNLAVALLHEPRLVVLDEPTVGVDAQSRAALLRALSDLRDGGTALLYTSHYMDEVARLCDRVGIVDRGRLLAEGAPAALVAEYPGATDLEGLFLELTGRALRD
jgi:ABC-2 type transport system ATP-binding protein